ncbi:acyl-CoA dehydrogenase C-terminal domain-containing protein [Deinococcus maricopensis]|uniref:3-methylmercaptopropionyl-CoA dehydrogenase n=1 Tax=Deinococcus maricopensis (strain DSM 21211 / LMG 22137 / NRRL B-23946 / LB-34) TaxID=709986 RepID=E8U739_DEIML|nr:acyl-CoA dehydrogenase C-terminal domain-containing protein [Deinococcus maricopensis]ADV66878.1 Butyryl-CoA dehydrogenase [Deinococcus maricopensis DSM 21211]
MPSYKAPLRDMRFIMHELLGAQDVLGAMPYYAENETHDASLLDQILDEAARFTENELQPLNQSGDQEGCTRHEDGSVTTPKGFKEAYKKYREAGWTALSADPQYGGQGLPHLVGNALVEMMNSANVAWSMYPGLSHGAYSALAAVGSDDLKATYLPKLVNGEWTGTMCLTEPHAGTDLGIIRTRARDNGDGTYAITGTKIFISAGEHDMADNILHLVLARLEGSPEGTKGISLFLVPKYLVNADGTLGERNTVVCGSIEHKMGIHGNATAVLNFDDAKGYLVGELNKGMNHMFIMMNAARLGTGLQGLGIGEVAYQNAVAYAKDRLQMRAPQRVRPDEAADPIIVHPDVRRMLLTAKAYTEAGRALAMWLALSLDVEHHHPDDAKRKEAGDLVALLTPIAKAFMTDNGFQSAVLAQQVFGGHGYIQEWGMEQFVRDARIGQIYEGTNGIQALDLIGRKVLMDGGRKLQKLAGMLETFLEENEGNEDLAPYLDTLSRAAQQVGTLTMVVGQKAMQNPDEANAVAVDYLRYVGHVTYAYLWARMAKIALDKQGDDKTGFYAAKLATAKFYFEKLFPETKALSATIKAGNDALAVDEAIFNF